MPAGSFRRHALAVALAAGLAGAAGGQSSQDPPAIPDTPAGRQLGGLLEAFNSGDPARYDAFVQAEYPTLNAPPGAFADFQAMSGGFDLVAIEASSDAEVTALLKEHDWDVYARIALTVEPEPPGQIMGLALGQTPPPADVAPVARMSETEALGALQARLEAAAAAGLFTGAVLVARDGAAIFDYVGGEADRENGVSNMLETKFRIGSMDKMFTAVSILQLAEAGRVALDAPIGTYLTDYPNPDLAQRVTVRHLLTHTGGTGDIFTPEYFARRLETRELSDYLDLFGARDVAFEPGDHFAYSNYGFILLGAIVEAVAGESYYDYVGEHVFTPAGMTGSGFLPEDVDVPGRAVGYTNRGGEFVDASDTLPYRGTSAGGGYSTVGDLIAFSEALRAGVLLSPDTLAEATTVQSAQTPNGGYGFGFGVGEVNGARSFGHNGGAPGMSADLVVFPDSGYALAVAANRDSQFVTRLGAFLGARLPME